MDQWKFIQPRKERESVGGKLTNRVRGIHSAGQGGEVEALFAGARGLAPGRVRGAQAPPGHPKGGSGSYALPEARPPFPTSSAKSREASPPVWRPRLIPSTFGSRAGSPSFTAATSPVQTPGGLQNWSLRPGNWNALSRRVSHRAEQGRREMERTDGHPDADAKGRQELAGTADRPDVATADPASYIRCPHGNGSPRSCTRDATRSDAHHRTGYGR